jgi:hypothetical protein
MSILSPELRCPRNFARGLKATGDVVVAFYNSPFVAPPFRRNEVMIPVG